MSDFIIVITTTDDRNIAENICKRLVEERLVACAQIFKDMKSFYWWKENIETSNEFFILLKTKKELFQRLERRIKELHNYSVPEIIALPIVFGSEEYFNWMLDNLI